MLTLENVCFEVEEKTQRTPKKILKNINLNIDNGKFVVVTGPNGSGKSTLAKIIMGIERPTSGRIVFDGTDITDLSIAQRAKLGIGFAFQQPVKFKGLTVRDLIEISVGEKVDVSVACSFLSDVGLCAREYINRELDDKLSGGELKRIEIAMLEARKARLSLFDEPEAGIDLWSFNNLIDVFKKIHHKNDSTTTIIISHQERIISIADEVILLNDGAIEKIGRPEEILSSVNAVSACKKIVGGNN